ncbi:MAG TPA: phosphate ABC transporter substrate-binding protein PstS [Gaiellaceae bacterium]
MSTRVLAPLLAATVVLAAGCGGGSPALVGAGSSLVAPLVAKWSSDYGHRKGVAVTYGAIGSGGGISQITARSVDFGATDAPLTPDEADACNGCLHVPWALTATLVSYHVKGVPNRLKLSGPVLARIFLGEIKHWNDPAIARLNPGVKLPDTTVMPVFRSDGSGDTYAFTDFLSKVSPAWKAGPGVAAQVAFPTGAGGKGNNGVAAAMSRSNGAIGYLALSYVLSNHLDYALVRNAAGKFPVPGLPSISAAAKAVTTIAADNVVSITNPPASAPGAYPISTYSYAIVPKSSSAASTLRPFLTYAITDGQRFGEPLQFAPLPSQVVDAGRRTIAEIK